ncbi:hypothetical protein [Butyricimonas virosa]|uniref:hypothetical protein n=1 Tax=Butyricimonas virosa TaxID=544645 RepID=UPI00242F5DF6|nr:hypothetical protein [Butyricimonas virosa]
MIENSRIEQVEKERFNSIFLRAIAFVFWFLGIILIDFPLDKLSMAIVAVVTSLFGILFFYAAIRVFRVFRKIKGDPVLQQALMNEMYLSFDYKSLVAGFYLTLIYVIILFLLSNFVDIPARIICLTIIYVAVVVTELRRFFLYRQ